MNLKYSNRPAFSLETVALQTVIHISPPTQTGTGFIPICQKMWLGMWKTADAIAFSWGNVAR